MDIFFLDNIRFLIKSNQNLNKKEENEVCGVSTRFAITMAWIGMFT